MKYIFLILTLPLFTLEAEKGKLVGKVFRVTGRSIEVTGLAGQLPPSSGNLLVETSYGLIPIVIHENYHTKVKATAEASATGKIAAGNAVYATDSTAWKKNPDKIIEGPGEGEEENVRYGR